MNAQDLKNSILQLAIQGKLVEQREEEGTAKELLEKIEVEKKRLIKEGKIKRRKNNSKSVKMKCYLIYQSLGNGLACQILLICIQETVFLKP
ncbi:hypothetical protein ODV97_06955 [Enterococcus gallinarum]|nr:hypothetical protein [Enterococcus gallinarum]